MFAKLRALRRRFFPTTNEIVDAMVADIKSKAICVKRVPMPMRLVRPPTTKQ